MLLEDGLGSGVDAHPRDSAAHVTTKVKGVFIAFSEVAGDELHHGDRFRPCLLTDQALGIKNQERACFLSL